MTRRAEDFRGRVRGTWEHQLAKDLRAEPEVARYEFITQLMTINADLGLLLARRCLRDKKYFRALLFDGLDRVRDISAIKSWLEMAAAPLGTVGLIRALHQHLRKDPPAVARARYWLWMACPAADRENPRVAKALEELRDDLRNIDDHDAPWPAAKDKDEIPTAVLVEYPHNSDIPPLHLATFRMVRNAFPGGISREDYFPLLRALHEGMPFRAIASAMRSFGVDRDVTYDAERAEREAPHSVVETARVRDVLLKHGFAEWCRER